MIVLDTDILTHYLQNQPRVVERRRSTNEEVVISIISRIETLQGRFATLMKAAVGDELLRGQVRLDQAERDLGAFRVLGITEPVVGEFDRLRQNRKLKKIGRGDLLIAAIVLANRATLVTRNVRDFRQVTGLSVENWSD